MGAFPLIPFDPFCRCHEQEYLPVGRITCGSYCPGFGHKDTRSVEYRIRIQGKDGHNAQRGADEAQQWTGSFRRLSAMSCETLLAALKDCLLHSDCVLKQGLLPSQCLKDHPHELPEQCQSLRKAAFECKKGMLDMRKRFRGNNTSTAGPAR